MDGAINFTIGLSEGIAWPWPIAVYLFLAGISGGAVAVALMLNFFRHKTETTPIIKSASIIGLATILLGMLCLVLDLTNPLYFWRILVYYNPTSVMSIGVMLLLFYIPLVAVLMVMSFADTFSKWPLLGWVKPVCDRLEKFRVWINAVVMVLAIAICAYTGFLISALIRFPLINTAVLPALFVASGISAGMAVTKILAACCFGAREEDPDMHVMAGHGNRGFLPVHDRHCPALRQRICQTCLQRFHRRHLGSRLLGRCRRYRFRYPADRVSHCRQKYRVQGFLLLCRNLCDRRHDVLASVHPLCRTDEHHRLSAINS